MTEPDDLGIDLDAWQPPPPPGGIADAVIARMREPVPASALDHEERSPRRRWLLGGAVLAATGAIVLVTWGVARAPASGAGEVIAERARHLDLGASSAELDQGATVRWRRDGHRLTAAQPQGTATWRVGSDDTLVIDAGATVASVEATGASLRVEVQMNLSDTRVISASAITAAAVAMVTIVVYEGHVKVAHGGQTVHVAPGSSFEVRPAEPPPEQLTVGGTPDRIAALEAEVAELRARLQQQDGLATVAKDGGTQVDPFRKPRTAACDEVSCIVGNADAACCAKFERARVERRGLADTLDRTSISAAIATVKAEVLACAGSYAGTVKARVEVAPSGKVTRVVVTPTDAAPRACVERVLATARFGATRSGGSFTYPFALAATCDVDDLLRRGTDAYAAGHFQAALAKFEAAYSCRRDAGTLLRVVMSACAARAPAKARHHWKRLTTTQQQQIVAVCVRNGISVEQVEGPEPDRDVTHGTLDIVGPPNAKVLLDGKEIGTSPIRKRVTAGRHRVSFVLGNDKHTFSVTVAAGKTTTLAKQRLLDP